MSSKQMFRAILVLNLIALALVGCGKKKNNNEVIPVVGAAPVVVAPPITPPPPGVDPNYWCYSKGGTYNHSTGVCKITDYREFGWNLYYGSLDTGVIVYLNDQVIISAGGSPKFYVGGVRQSAASFVSTSSGSLVIKGNSWDSFRLKSIEISRCYNNAGQLASCY